MTLNIVEALEQLDKAAAALCTLVAWYNETSLQTANVVIDELREVLGKSPLDRGPDNKSDLQTAFNDMQVALAKENKRKSK